MSLVTIEKYPMMSLKGFQRLGVVVFCIAYPAIAQESSALSLARAAFTSNSSLSSVTLDGTFTSTEGSLREQGNAHFVVSTDGSYAMSLSKAHGYSGEERTNVSDQPVCTWKDAEGAIHATSECETPAWFLPELQTLLPLQSKPRWIVTPASDPLHLIVADSPRVDKNGRVIASPPVLDLTLSPETSLPTSAKYEIRSDDHPNVLIAVLIKYSDYHSVANVSIPFRVQKYLNGTLVLDVTFSSANVK